MNKLYQSDPFNLDNCLKAAVAHYKKIKIWLKPLIQEETKEK